jgi:urease accessory protein
MLQGHLKLVCAPDPAGRSHVSAQSFCAPVHLSKPHLDEGVLIVNVVNPTAGLFEGDRVEFDVSVETGARVLLTAPSASRAHRAHGAGAGAFVEQHFHVERGAWMEVWPELFIPQAACRYRQKTEARVEEGGEMMLIEMIAPGRVASGEVFAFGELDWESSFYLGGDLIARERYTLTPASPALDALRARFPEAYYASAIVVSERLGSGEPCWQRIHDLQDETAWVGCSALRRRDPRAGIREHRAEKKGGGNPPGDLRSAGHAHAEFAQGVGRPCVRLSAWEPRHLGARWRALRAKKWRDSPNRATIARFSGAITRIAPLWGDVEANRGI